MHAQQSITFDTCCGYFVKHSFYISVPSYQKVGFLSLWQSRRCAGFLKLIIVYITHFLTDLIDVYIYWKVSIRISVTPGLEAVKGPPLATLASALLTQIYKDTQIPTFKEYRSLLYNKTNEIISILLLYLHTCLRRISCLS